MSNPQFTIPYNGDNVEVTALNDASFLIQVTYKPFVIKQTTSDDGNSVWIDGETNVKSPLAAELGGLISQHYVPFAMQQ